MGYKQRRSVTATPRFVEPKPRRKRIRNAKEGLQEGVTKKLALHFKA
jgi:hypothetical protein